MAVNGKAVDPQSGSKSSSYHSQKATIADMSILEKLDMIPALLTVVSTTILALFTGVLKATERRPQSYYRFVALSALRRFVERTSTRQQHMVSPPTDTAYEKVCRKRGQTPKSEILADGTRAHWIGDSNAEKIVLNFHGGGYVMPATDYMVDFMFQIVENLNKKGKNAACLFLAYDLAPGALWPRPLAQASALINHITGPLSLSPSNIIITGDSAGANLALALLSHISHPHPSSAIPRVSLETPFLGLCLISPWVSFDTTLPSFQENEFKDCVSQVGGKKWSASFLGEAWPHPTKADRYNEALQAPPEWWEGVMVENMCVMCGSEEVLRDGIVAFEKKLRQGVKGKVNVEFTIVRGEYHDQPNLDLQIGYKEKDEGETAKLAKSWIASKL